MIKYSILSPNQAVIRTGTCPAALLTQQAGAGETVVEGWVDIPNVPPVLNYTAKRRLDYPTIGAQLDMLWHSMNSGELPKSNAFFAAVKAVKDQYPKASNGS